MPMCPFTPPRRKGLNHRQHQAKASKPTSKSKPKTLTQPPLAHNYDKELLQYLATTSQQVPLVGDDSAMILNSSLSMPYTKDFGSFDLTISKTEDKKPIVLVKYEGRVFINGIQIYIQEDGRVCDNHGSHDPVLQKYYDHASRIRRRLRRRQSTLQKTDDDVQPTSEQNSSRVDRNRACLSDTLNNEPNSHTLRERGLTSDKIQPPLVAEIVDNGVSVGAELQDLENRFSHIVTRLCKLILSVTVDQEGTDTESAHSEGDFHSPHQRQLLQEALHRFSYKFQSVLELSKNLHDEITELADGGKQAKDESSKMPRFSSAGFACNGLTASVSSTTFTGSASSVVNYHHGESVDARELRPDMPAYIHDSKSLENENARLHAELAASKSELRRLRRQHNELQLQSDQEQSVRVELQELLTEYEEENSHLKQRFMQFELHEIKSRELVQKDELNEEGVGIVPEILTLDNCDNGLTEGDREIIITNPRNMPTTEDECTDIRSKQKYRSNENGSLKSEMKRLRHVADDMEEDLERMSRENVSLRMRVIKFERDRKDLKEKLQAAESLSEDTKSDMAVLDKKVAELETRCQNLEREKTAGQVESDRTSSMLADLRSRYRTLERDTGELEKKVKLLKAEKRQQCDELDRLQQTQMECKNKSVKLMKDNGDLQVAVSQLNRDKSNLEAETSMLRVENEENIAGRKKAEESWKAVLTELRELRRAHVEISEQVTSLRDTAITAEARCKTLKDQNEELVRKTQDMESQNKGLEIRTRDLSNTGRLLEVENSELKHMLRRLQFENAEMKTKIAALTKTNADFRTKMEQWDRANASAEGIMRNLVREKGDLQNGVRQLASLGTRLGTDVESRFENMDNFCVQLQEVQRSKTQLVDADTSTDVSEVSSLVLADVQAGDNAEPHLLRHHTEILHEEDIST